MHRATQSRVGIGALLVAVFFVLAPVPFLSRVTEDPGAYGDFPYAVLRLGQSFAQPKLVERAGDSAPQGAKAVQVDGVAFVVEIAPGVLWDEIEAIVDSVARPEIKSKHPSGQRLTFVGWEPDFLPLRIQYRYILLVALVLFTGGTYLLLTRTESEA